MFIVVLPDNLVCWVVEKSLNLVSFTLIPEKADKSTMKEFISFYTKVAKYLTRVFTEMGA